MTKKELDKEMLQNEISGYDEDIRRTTAIINNLIQRRAELMEKRTALADRLKRLSED